MNLINRIFPDRHARLSIAELLGQVWVMEPQAVEAFLGELQQARQHLAASGELRASMGGGGHGEEEPLEVLDGVARIRIEGPIVKQVPGWARYYGVRLAGAQDAQLQLARALADTNVRSILLVIDSPGGTLAGVQELGDAIFAARAVKPIYTYGSDLVASAAYWCGAQASRFTANRAAQLGSIGVYTIAVDASRFYESAGIKVEVIRAGELKGAGTFGTPITDAQRASWQAMVDGAGRLFVEAVARGRGLAVEQVQQLATGATWYADEARALGLIDGVESADVAHASCAEAVLEDAPRAAPEEPPGADDEVEPPEQDASSISLPTEAAASTTTTNPHAPTGAEGPEAMSTKPIAGAPATTTLNLEQASQRIAQLERELALSEQERALTTKAGTSGRKTELLEAAIQDGRLAPAMRGDAEAYADACGDDVARFERFLGTLKGSTVRQPAGRSPTRPLDEENGASAASSRGDIQVARRLGISSDLLEASSQIDHYTADGKVVLRDGKVRELASFAPKGAAAAS